NPCELLTLPPRLSSDQVDHEPKTVVYSLQSSLFVTVLNDEDSPSPIYNATVNVAPNVLPGMGANIDGVYAFVLVPPGNYSSTVSDRKSTRLNSSHVKIS